MTVTPDTFDPEAALRRGDEEEERSSGNFRKEPHWDLKEGEEAILRFLQESKDWFRVQTHRFFPTKAEPSDYEGKWPGFMPATCRKDPAFADRYAEQGGCPICSSGHKNKFGKVVRAEDLRYTLAVEREAYTDENGKKAYRDKMVEIPILDEKGEPTEEKISAPSVVIVSQTMYMMMSALKACGESYDTLRDRDYRIKRVKNPSGNGTIYQVFPLDKTPDIAPGTEHWEFYDLAVQAHGLKLPTLIFAKSTNEYYERFFLEEDGFTSVDVRRETGELAPAARATGGSKGGPSIPAQPTAANAPTRPDADALAAMRARISKQG
jgi:hypothetical protein